MRSSCCLLLAVALLVVANLGVLNAVEQQQQVGARILRRVIKSTPTATNLTRVRLVTVRATSGAAPERGAVSEISSKEAASFGQRSSNETSATTVSVAAPALKSPKQVTSALAQSSSTTSTTTTAKPSPPSEPFKDGASNSSATLSTSSSRSSERLQLAPTASESVELLSSAPSSWQMMTVEAPAPAAAALIAAGTRAASVSGSDLSSSSSEQSSFAASNDFLRSSASATKSNYVASNVGETFSRLRQSKTSQQQQQQQQQQNFFYPQQQRAQVGKTSQYQATKTHWYQPSTTTTTPRPAPLIQQHYVEQQQNEQYVEQQQQQVEAAPPGLAEPFAFDFNTQDNSGNGQYRKEESDSNGVVRGSYGYTDASGIYRHVDYVADHNGFRANIKSNEPGLIGETQPASIRLDGSNGERVAPPAQPITSQRFSVASESSSTNEWAASSNQERADLALAPPDFESSHKPERIRATRAYSN